jgi:predicted nucleotidyltransferase
VRSLRLFGSRLHGTATDANDIDLLIEFEPSRHFRSRVLAESSLIYGE